MSAAGHALELALACYRAPPRLAQAAQRALPDDMLVLLRLAAGDEALAQECADTAHESPGIVVDAAVFFIQQVLFAPGTDSYRALGVNPDAPDARIKEHYRWLVRWLHPDRNPDEWDAIYADRVNRAWQDLRHPDRRAAYDLSLADGTHRAPVGAASAATAFARTVAAEAAPTKAAAPARVRISAEHAAAPLLSGRTAQRMPLIVLGTLGAVAGAALALMWYAQTPRPAPTAASAEVAATTEPSPVPEPVAALESSPAPEPDMAPAVVGAASAAKLSAEYPANSFAAEGAPTESKAEAKAEAKAEEMLASVPESRPAPATPAAAAARPTIASTPPPPPVGAASAAKLSAETPPKSVAAEAAPTGAVAATTAAAPAVTASEPAAAPTAPAAEPAAPAPIAEAAAQAVLSQYTAAYANGDIRALMRLFTLDATNNRGNRDAIAYDYQELFSSSETREITLSTTGWLANDTTATVLAKYEAKVKRPGRWLPSTSRGDIRFDLAYENGALRIKTIRHD